MYKLYTDGGSRGNPGKAAIGGVILNNENSVGTFSKYIGIQTNNFAEYTALLEGLNICISKNILAIDCFLDSDLVVKQLNGIYKVKNANIKPVYLKIKALLDSFDRITFTHVRREFNKVADALVNEALDNL